MGNSGTKIVRTTTWSAGPGCHGGCGVLAHIKDDKLVKIEGDPDHPWNQGRLCARALAMTQYVENPARLQHGPGQLRGFAGVHPPENDRHRQGGHLVIRQFVPGE